MAYRFGFTMAMALVAWAPVLASGYGQFEPGVQGLGSGGAFVARAEDGSAVFYNPAGLAQLSYGEIALSGKGSFSKSYYSNVGQSTWDSSSVEEAFPAFIWSGKLGDRIGFAIGYLNTYDHEIAWEEPDFPVRFRADSGSFQVNEAVAAIAFKLNDRFSIGATARYLQADWERTNIEARPFDSALPSQFYETRQRFEGDDQALGFTVGLQYRRGRRLAVGLSYQSSVDLTLEGVRSFAQITRLNDVRAQNAFARDFRSGVPFSHALTLPDRIAAGYATRITVRTRLEVDLAYTRWSEIERTAIETTGPDGQPQTVAYPRNWDDSLEVRISGDFQQRRALLWRMALGSVAGAVPAATIDPAFPDDDRFMYSFGVSYTFRKRYILEAGWTYVQNRDTNVQDQELVYSSDNPPDFLVTSGQDGLYETQRTLLTIGLRIKLGRFADDDE